MLDRGGDDTPPIAARRTEDRKSTRLNSSHPSISYAVFCLKKKNTTSKLIGSEAGDTNKLKEMNVPRKDQLVVFRIRFFFNDTAPTEIYPLSLHDALPI